MIKRFRDERGDIGDFFGWVVLGLLLLFFAVAFGLCNLFDGDNNNHNGLGTIQLVSHEYECIDHDSCGDYGGGYEDGYGGGSGGNSGGRYEGAGSQQASVSPQSLFPPTPEGIRDFVVNTTKSGIEMGRLFAETTITFVENLMVGLA